MFKFLQDIVGLFIALGILVSILALWGAMYVIEGRLERRRAKTPSDLLMDAFFMRVENSAYDLVLNGKEKEVV